MGSPQKTSCEYRRSDLGRPLWVWRCFWPIGPWRFGLEILVGTYMNGKVAPHRTKPSKGTRNGDIWGLAKGNGVCTVKQNPAICQHPAIEHQDKCKELDWTACFYQVLFLHIKSSCTPYSKDPLKSEASRGGLRREPSDWRSRKCCGAP